MSFHCLVLDCFGVADSALGEVAVGLEKVVGLGLEKVVKLETAVDFLVVHLELCCRRSCNYLFILQHIFINPCYGLQEWPFW